MRRRAASGLRWGGAWLLLAAFTAGGCSQIDDNVRETAVNVLTLQSGTISELKDRRGTGPFRTYARAPEQMLRVLRAAAAKAKGAGGRPVRAIFVSERRGEVIAKERTGEDAAREGYAAPFRSAMVATVHAVPGAPTQSRVEIHAMDRGPFHQGQVEWEREMPRWIDEVLAEPGALEPQPATPRIRPIR